MPPCCVWVSGRARRLVVEDDAHELDDVLGLVTFGHTESMHLMKVSLDLVLRQVVCRQKHLGGLHQWNRDSIDLLTSLKDVEKLFQAPLSFF